MGVEQPLQAFYSEHFEPLFLRSRTANTRRLYLTSLRHFTRFLQRPPTLADLNDSTVARYLGWFRGLPRSPASVNKERSNLLAIWRFAARKGWLKEWPDVEPEREPERIPQAWMQADIDRLLWACDQQPGMIDTVPAAAWWRAIHFVCWDTGERIGGIRDLEWSTVDLDSGTVIAPAETRKGGRADRMYRLAPDTIQHLKAIRLPARKWVFPWPYTHNYLWKRYDKILLTAGFAVNRKSKFHRMRRSVASHFEAAGGNATELLGHSRRRTTKAYLDPRIVPQEHAIDRLFRPGGKAG